MKKNEHVVLDLQSMYSFYNTDNLLPLIRLHIDVLPEYIPTKWGLDKLTIPFSWESVVDNIKNAIAYVEWSRTGKDRANGAWWMRWTPAPGIVDRGFNHATIYINVFSTKHQKSLLQYLKSAAIVGKANYGYIEAYTEKYEPIGRMNRSINMDLLSPITHILRHWLPDMRWASVFGPDYIKMFGMERLLTTPAYKVEALSDEEVFIQLTPDLNDLWDEFDAVQAAREKAKQHLGYESFWQEKLAYDWKDHGELAGKIFRVPAEFTKIDDM